jgi:hypothetical protein
LPVDAQPLVESERAAVAVTVAAVVATFDGGFFAIAVWVGDFPRQSRFFRDGSCGPSALHRRGSATPAEFVSTSGYSENFSPRSRANHGPEIRHVHCACPQKKNQ